MDTTTQASDHGSYATDTPLTHVFGENARVRIIAAMLSERDRDLNVSDIAGLAGVARSTVYDHMDELREMHMVVQTREVGSSPMYQINNDNPIIERIHEIEGLALKELLDSESK